MKNNSLIAIILLGLIAIFNACHSPEDIKPSESRVGINSISAKFVNEDGSFEGEFKGYPVEGEKEIIVQIPYFYPEHSDNKVEEAMLKKMRVEANLVDNVVLSPSILYMDLTQENRITVKDQVGALNEYIIKGEIYKSTQCQIEEFSIPSLGLSGVINEEAKTISLVSTDPIGKVLADVKISAHSSISPNPATETLDYDKDVQLTVTAFDGTTKATYTVKKSIPNKIDFGIRSGSAKLMFAKKLNKDLGVADNVSTGLAAFGDYLLINSRGLESTYINAKTGEKVGTIQFGSFVNNYSTSDDAGNILVSNFVEAGQSNDFKLVKLTNEKADPIEIITWNSGGQSIGSKVSVIGDINSDAIITAPLYGVNDNKFARWQIKEGSLVSQIPTLISISGYEKKWTTNADVIYTSPTDLNSDYFATAYSINQFGWINGRTNEVSKKLDVISTNFIPNALDFTEFNNAKYVTLNWLNSFSWGSADIIWLLDVSSNALFEGSLEAKRCKAVIWESERNKWGTNGLKVEGITSPINDKQIGDVVLKVSDNGYFLYLYFMFNNGYVVGYQFDCIDM